MMWDVCRAGSGRTVAIVPGATLARHTAAALNRTAGGPVRFDYVRHGQGWIGTPPAPVAVRVWDAIVARAWYAFGCPPRFPLRRIGGAR